MQHQILTFRIPPRPPPELPTIPARTRRAKVLLVTSSQYDLERRFGIDWRRVIQPGLLVTETKKIKSTKQMSLESKKFDANNLVVYCHQDDVRAFVIAVGITKGCSQQDMMLRGQWQVLATGWSWNPFESTAYQWTCDDERKALSKVLRKPYSFAHSVPKFWSIYESLMRSMTMKTNGHMKRLVIFVEKAFELSKESLDAFQQAYQNS